jgi:hypothetical protein
MENRKCTNLCYLLRTMTQTVRPLFLMAAAQVRLQDRSCGIYGGPCGTGVSFLEYFGFIFEFSFQRLLHTQSNIPSGALL